MKLIATCGISAVIGGLNLKGLYGAFKVLKNGGVTPQTILIGVFCNIFNIVKLVDFIIDLVKGKPPSKEFQIGKVLGQFIFTVAKIIGAGDAGK